MPTPYQPVKHSGNAPEATLAVPMGDSDLSFTLSPTGVGANYADGTAWIETDPGKTTNEKIFYTSRSGDTFTIASLADRGLEGTTRQAHTAGAVVRHIYSATEAQESNDAVVATLGQIAAKGDLLYGAGPNALKKVAKGTSGQYPAWNASGDLVPTSPAITSVAGRTGAVTLTTADVPGALDQRTITKPVLSGYTEQVTAASPGATVTYDATTKNVYDTTLTANLTVTLTAAGSGVSELSLVHRQDATGGWTVTWPASVTWPNGVAPSPDTNAGAINVYSLFTVDAGATWFGFLAGRGMA